MNSIKTFWSPELKKERALRKDEAAKMSMWKEQYRVVQDETQVSVCVLPVLSVHFHTILVFGFGQRKRSPRIEASPTLAA